MIDQDVLERVLHRALRDGGDFAEVFAEDRVASNALLDDGPLPLAVLESRIDEWIARQR